MTLCISTRKEGTMGLLAMAYGIQDEDTWMWDGPATNRSQDEGVESPLDDWAVNPPAPPDGCVWDDMARLRRHMRAWEHALGAPETTVPALELRLLVKPDSPEVYRDSNLEEREDWLRWAKRRHPEWGTNPKPPRRLAPRKELVRPAEKGWAVLVLFLDNNTGYPEVVARRNLAGEAPEDLHFEWPRNSDTRRSEPRAEIIRRMDIGSISLRGEWDWDPGGTDMRPSFPTTTARKAWVEAHAEEISKIMSAVVM